MSLRVCATTRPKHRSTALRPSLPRLRRGRGQTYEVWFIKGDFLYEVSTYKELEFGLESDLYKSVNRRYAAEEFALQLRALCSDHPVDGPSFDQVALRVALSFGCVVAEDKPAGQLGRRSQHSLVMLDHGI